MKTLMILFVCLSFFIRCHEPEPEAFICDTPILGYFDAETNYDDWKNSSCYYSLISDTSMILYFASLDAYCNLVALEISKVQMKAGKNEYNNDAYLIELTGEDGVLGFYRIDTSYANEINILNIDKVKNEVSGKIDLQLLPDEKLSTKYNKVIYFRNSPFTAKLSQ